VRANCLNPKDISNAFPHPAAALVAANLMTGPRAEAASYCYDGELGQTCGFVSLQQCLDAVWGTVTGTCYADPATPQQVVRTPPRKRVAH
jgi:hypothetical protein